MALMETVLCEVGTEYLYNAYIKVLNLYTVSIFFMYMTAQKTFLDSTLVT